MLSLILFDRYSVEPVDSLYFSKHPAEDESILISTGEGEDVSNSPTARWHPVTCKSVSARAAADPIVVDALLVRNTPSRSGSILEAEKRTTGYATTAWSGMYGFAVNSCGVAGTSMVGDAGTSDVCSGGCNFSICGIGTWEAMGRTRVSVLSKRHLRPYGLHVWAQCVDGRLARVWRPRAGMSENADKRQCVRDHPSCWTPTVLVNSPAPFVPTPLVPAAPAVPPPGSDERVCHVEPTCPAASVQSEAMGRLAEAQRRSLKYRDPGFPGAGLLREDGGVFGVMSRAISEGRSSWL